MNDQSPNEQLNAQDFLQGHNTDYVEALQAKHAADPSSVDAAWAEYFKALGETQDDATRAAAGPSWARRDWPPVPNDDLTAALTGNGRLLLRRKPPPNRSLAKAMPPRKRSPPRPPKKGSP